MEIWYFLFVFAMWNQNSGSLKEVYLYDISQHTYIEDENGEKKTTKGQCLSEVIFAKESNLWPGY